eukprot:SAG31_NODE_1197_length_9441_cov_5.823592_3_plen_217_part_00
MERNRRHRAVQLRVVHAREVVLAQVARANSVDPGLNLPWTLDHVRIAVKEPQESLVCAAAVQMGQLRQRIVKDVRSAHRVLLERGVCVISNAIRQHNPTKRRPCANLAHLANTAYRVTPATDARLLDIIHRMRSAASRVQMGRHRQLHALGVSSAQKEGLGQVASAPSVQLVVRPQQIDQRAISAHQMKRELEDYAQLALPESNQTMVRHPVKPVH